MGTTPKRKPSNRIACTCLALGCVASGMAGMGLSLIYFRQDIGFPASIERTVADAAGLVAGAILIAGGVVALAILIARREDT